MKFKIFVLLIVIVSIFINFPKKIPKPTEYMLMKNAKKIYKLHRKQWIEEMHKAAPGTDWRKIDAKTRQIKNEKKLQKRKALAESGELKKGKTYKENFRDITGHWVELGSNNLAGRMLTVDYDYSMGVLYGASQGGNIWVGTLDGNWTNSINDYIQFNDIQAVKAIHMGDTTRIVVAQRNPAVLYYTDNNGLSWDAYQGFSGSGNIIRAIIKNDSTMFVAKSDGALTRIYKFNKQIQNFESIAIFTVSENGFDMWLDNENELFVIENNALHHIDSENNINDVAFLDLDFGNSSITKAILTGNFNNGNRYLYVMYRANSSAFVYRSEDGGNRWVFTSQINNDYLVPFTKNSFSCSPIDPMKVYAGGMECYRSFNGGYSFVHVNNWWDYYNDMEHKLHADVPEIKPIVFEGVIEYDIISTDGGTFISSDNLQSVLNISLSGLRVSQYYSTYSNRSNPAVVFAGAQDQGLQLSTNGDNQLADFTQLISGDYGHLVSGDGGESFWAVYPGFVIYYPNYQNPTVFYSIDFSGNGFLWMPPIMEDPLDATKVYLGGGGTNSGYHLTHISYNNGSLSAEEESYNFLGGFISAMGYSKLNTNYRYVLTKNGKFYFSTDGGVTWEETQSFNAPHSHYFYGSTIEASEINSETVYIGGSGYSNSAVYVSYDHGVTFEAMDEGLPNTLVFELAITEDDNYLFAATEVGPYVCDLSQEQKVWQSIEGITAPDQTYWGVDYIPSVRTARFATYGRGIWDFVIDSNANTDENQIVEATSLKAFPNPFVSTTKIELKTAIKGVINYNFEIYNLKGQKITDLKPNDKNSHLPYSIWNGKNKFGKNVANGIYLCKIKADNKLIGTIKITKLK